MVTDREEYAANGFLNTFFWVTLLTTLLSVVGGALSALEPPVGKTNPPASVSQGAIEGGTSGIKFGLALGTVTGLGIAALRTWKT